jgi:hypothetical protein
MTKIIAKLLLAAALFSLFYEGAAYADESKFLGSLDGNWSGTGTVKLRADSSPVRVSCKFKSDTTASSLELDGKCTGFVVVSRNIGANLKAQGANYRGSYVGSATGTAGLAGKRSGNSINLGIRWAKEVNGDRVARLTIEKLGETAMRLTTVDTHPTSGKSIITSRIDLRRS